MFKIKTNCPQFFMEHKAYGHMARFKNIENPMLKKTKLFLVDVANTLAFVSILAYCLTSIGFSAYMANQIHSGMQYMFHVEP